VKKGLSEHAIPFFRFEPGGWICVLPEPSSLNRRLLMGQDAHHVDTHKIQMCHAFLRVGRWMLAGRV